MTPPDPPPTNVPAPKLPFWMRIRQAMRGVFMKNSWIIPAALILGAAAAAMGYLTDRREDVPNQVSLQITQTLLLMLPGLVILVIRTRGWFQLLGAGLICVPAALAWHLGDQESSTSAMSQIGSIPVPGAYTLGRYLIMAGLLSPIVALWGFQRTTLLDRYVLRQFLAPFFFCLIAFFSIWLIFDLNDNLSDFREHRPAFRDILNFYFVQIPHIFTKIAEVAVLIATVYALSGFSKSNEFIAMLVSGRSLGRTLLPLFCAGIYISFVYLVFNYQLAPQGEGTKESLLDQFSGDDKKTTSATKHLFVNQRDNRTWYIGEIPYYGDSDGETEELRFVDIQEQGADNRRIRSLQASSATWDSSTRKWTFHRTLETKFTNDGLAPTTVYSPYHVETDWSETPWQLVNQRMDPDHLGVPGLLSYVQTSARDGLQPPRPFLTNLYHRWAAPWGCFAILFVAAPLGITFSRKGLLGGVASAVFVFGAVLFLTELFLALGKSGYLSPALAAWLSNAIFLVLGGLFLYLRARNRTLRLPSLRTVRA